MNNWNTNQLKDITNLQSGGTPLTSNKSYYGTGYTWITISDMTKCGKYLIKSEKEITDIGLKNSNVKLFPPNTIWYSMYASIGSCTISKVEAGSSQAILAITSNDINLEYLYYWLKFTSESAKKQGQQGTQSNLNKKIVGEMVINYPSLKNEQNLIVQALSSIDNTIFSLQRMINKKEAIFNGFIEDLLTGKKRLPGFNNKWISHTMDYLFKFSGGLSISRDNLGNQGYLYLHYGDIHLSDKTYIDIDKNINSLPKYDTNKVPKNKLLNHGDIVFVDASEDLDGVSKYWVVENIKNIPFIAGSHTLVARNITTCLDINFTKYCFLVNKVKKQFQLYAVGTKVSGINKTSIKKITLSFPSDLNEQKAIAHIFSGMESELTTLQLKLAKLKFIKNGMSEQLLTGKIRLPLN